MTYEEIVVYSEVFSKKLVGEKCCAILCGSELAASMALLSCFAAQVTAVPLSARYGQAHCSKILDMINPTALITDIDGELQVLHITDAKYIEPEVHPALIMCTSGTTGLPKGAMLSEENIRTNVQDICAYFHITHFDSLLIARPLYHCAVLTGEFLTALIKGAKIHFYSEQFNPKRILTLIAERQITVFCGTPTLLGMMARYKRENAVCSLRTICVSGECMAADVGKKIAEAFPDAMIYHVYGLTEACPRISYLPPERFAQHTGSVGVPLNAVRLKIIDANGRVAGKGQEGVLWVRGANIMLGYYNAPEYTSKVLQGGWLCTGDIAVIDEEGLLWIKGRFDDLIIRAGMNIYPQEIEQALKKDSRVREVLAYGVDDPISGQQIAIEIAGDFSDKDEVKKLCLTVLPAFQVPSRINLVDELPKNGSGKLLRGGHYARV